MLVLIIHFLLLSSAHAGVDTGAVAVPAWQRYLNSQICEEQASFLQDTESMEREMQARLQTVFSAEHVSSVQELGKIQKLHYSSRGLVLRSLFLAVASGNTAMSVDLTIVIQNICKRLTPAEPSFRSCENLKELIARPQEFKAGVNAQVKFLREKAKPTGREVTRSIDGRSLNVIDERDGAAGQHVGYGFWSFISTGKLCFNPSGCFYPAPSNVKTVTQPEYEMIPIEACADRKTEMDPASSGILDNQFGKPVTSPPAGQ